MFLPNLPLKDYFCLEDAKKGNCFRKERSRKTSLDPFIWISSNLKFIGTEKQSQIYYKMHPGPSTEVSLGSVSVPPAPSSFEQKVSKKKIKPHPGSRGTRHLAKDCGGDREGTSPPATWHSRHPSAARGMRNPRW